MFSLMLRCMVFPEQYRTIPEMVDRFPGILGGRISPPFHKIMRLSANSFEVFDFFSFVFSVFFFGVLELNVCCCSRRSVCLFE